MSATTLIALIVIYAVTYIVIAAAAFLFGMWLANR